MDNDKKSVTNHTNFQMALTSKTTSYHTCYKLLILVNDFKTHIEIEASGSLKDTELNSFGVSGNEHSQILMFFSSKMSGRQQPESTDQMHGAFLTVIPKFNSTSDQSFQNQRTNLRDRIELHKPI